MRGLGARYEDEITSLLQETANRVNAFKEHIHEQQEHEQLTDALQQLNAQHEKEKDEFMNRFSAYKASCESRIAETKRVSKQRVDKLSADVTKMRMDGKAADQRVTDAERRCAAAEKELEAARSRFDAELETAVKASNEERLEQTRRFADELKEARDAGLAREHQMERDHEKALQDVVGRMAAETQRATTAEEEAARSQAELARTTTSLSTLQARYDTAILDLDRTTQSQAEAGGMAQELQRRLTAAEEARDAAITEGTARADEYAIKMAGFEAQVKKTTGDLKTAVETLMAKNAELRALEEEVDRLRGQTEGDAGQLTGLQGEVARATAEIADLKAALDTTRTEAAHAAEEAANEVNGLRAGSAARVERIAALEADLGRATAIATGLESELAATRARADDAEVSLAKATSTGTEATELVASLEGTIADQMATIEAMKAEAEAGRGERGHLKQRLDVETAEVATLRQRMADTLEHGDEWRGDMTRRLGEAEGMAARLNEELQKAQDVARAAEEAAGRAGAEAAEIREAAEAQATATKMETDARAAEQQATIDTLQAEVDRVTADLTAVSAALSTAQARAEELGESAGTVAQTLHGELDGARRDLDNVKAELQMALNAVGATEQELAAAREVSGGLQVRVDELTKEAKAAEEARQQTIAEWTAKMEALETAHAEALQDIEARHASELAGSQSSGDREVSRLRDEAEARQGDMARLEAALKEAEDRATREARAMEEEHAAAMEEQRTRLETEAATRAEDTEKEWSDRLEAQAQKMTTEHAAGVKEVAATLRAQQAAWEEDKTRLMVDVDRLTREVDRLTDEGRALEKGKAELEAGQQALRDRLGRALNDLEEARLTADQRAEALKVELNRQLDDEVRRCADEVSRARSTADRDLARLQEELEAAREEMMARYEGVIDGLEAEKRQWGDRASRPEDLEAIDQLRAAASEREIIMAKMKKELDFFRRELLNREEMYNKTFSRQANVGVLDPLAKKKPHSSGTSQLPPLSLGGMSGTSLPRVTSARGRRGGG